MDVRRRVIVRGRVQGVWFRGSTRDRAHREGVRGWVRNLHDGRVEAVFEGSSEAVAAMLDFCRTGPRSARVARIEVFEEETEGLSGFKIV